MAFKDIEHRAALEAEAMGLKRKMPRTGPENVRGIEINPYTAELPRASVSISEIQWMRKTGFKAARTRILHSLNTIECSVALLAPNGSPADGPAADVVRGNPPFLGNKKMIAELSEAYTTALRRRYLRVPGGLISSATVPIHASAAVMTRSPGAGRADLVCYWFAKTWEMIKAGRLTRAGLVAPNSISGGANRAVMKPIVEGGRICKAWSDEPWTTEGAAMRVSLGCFDGQKRGPAQLDGRGVTKVFAELTTAQSGADRATALVLDEKSRTASNGISEKRSFDVSRDLARLWLTAPVNPNEQPSSDVLFPWFHCSEITRQWTDTWIIDMGGRAPEKAALYEAPVAHLQQTVQQER